MAKYIEEDKSKYCDECYNKIKNSKNMEIVLICDKCINIPVIVRHDNG